MKMPTSPSCMNKVFRPWNSGQCFEAPALQWAQLRSNSVSLANMPRRRRVREESRLTPGRTAKGDIRVPCSHHGAHLFGLVSFRFFILVCVCPRTTDSSSLPLSLSSLPRGKAVCQEGRLPWCIVVYWLLPNTLQKGQGGDCSSFLSFPDSTIWPP